MKSYDKRYKDKCCYYNIMLNTIKGILIYLHTLIEYNSYQAIISCLQILAVWVTPDGFMEQGHTQNLISILARVLNATFKRHISHCK